LDHLRQAAEHLKAAGLADEATRIRQLAEAEVKRQSQTLLKQKEAQLKALQAEVDKLRSAVGSQQQVMVQVQIYEIDSSKIRKLGIDHVYSPGNSTALFEDIFTGTPDCAEKPESRYRIVERNDAHLAALVALEREGLVKLIASPCLVTISGQPAQIRQGGEIQVAVSPADGELKAEPRSIGTEVDIVPQVLADQCIRLDFRIKLSELADELTNASQVRPRLNIRQINTGVELKSGQVLILGGMKQDRDSVTVNRSADPPTMTTTSRTIETLFIVRPELIDASTDRR
jgi:Flp pilus assembly secretin CpaC